ncbi:acyl-CoA thioesterase [Parerythrobacter aurantius]|uniref:acyl-CoA thioesterase n=1 Tax=Parerythrobacter aurantius TaxID=3127706 RepID=UPI003245F456
MTGLFRRTFTAEPRHIDVMGHVNNAVWVEWIQDMATAHWDAVAAREHAAAYVWLVVRHEIDYRGNIGEGDSVTGETWIPGEPRGATSARRVDFRDDAGKVIVSALTTWAMLDRETRRPVRVRPEVVAPFRLRD